MHENGANHGRCNGNRHRIGPKRHAKHERCGGQYRNVRDQAAIRKNCALKSEYVLLAQQLVAFQNHIK